MDECVFRVCHLMASVRPTHSDKHIVFPGKISSDIAFSLTSILSANENIDERHDRARKKSKLGNRPYHNIVWIRSLSVHDDICNMRQVLNAGFCWTCTYLRVRCELPHLRWS